MCSKVRMIASVRASKCHSGNTDGIMGGGGDVRMEGKMEKRKRKERNGNKNRNGNRKERRVGRG